MEHGRRHGELLRAIKKLEEDVHSCRSREAAATARVSLLRELASADNSAGLDVALRYSRGRDETSRTGPNAPLELAQPDFVCSALDETKKLESTFGLHGEMDEFRRLNIMYSTASHRELAEFQVFAKAVAARREDGCGSEDRGEDNEEDTGDDRRRGRHRQQAAARRMDGMDQPGRARPAPESARSEGPRRNIRCEQSRASPAREGFPGVSSS